MLSFYQKLGRNCEQTGDILKKLEVIDPYRKEYYRDTRSKLILAECQTLLADEQIKPFVNAASKADLSRRDFTIFTDIGHLYTCHTIDLSYNSLKTLDRLYLSVVDLNLDNNLLYDVNCISGMPFLQKLSVRNNSISD